MLELIDHVYYGGERLRFVAHGTSQPLAITPTRLLTTNLVAWQRVSLQGEPIIYFADDLLTIVTNHYDHSDHSIVIRARSD